MLKKTIIAGLAIAVSAVALQPVEKAQARVNVDIGFAVPGPVYYGDYYRPRYYYAPRPVYYDRITCGQARRVIRQRGFYRIRAVRCHGASYVFHAKKRGMWWRMNVRARTGSIYRVRHLY